MTNWQRDRKIKQLDWRTANLQRDLAGLEEKASKYLGPLTLNAKEARSIYLQEVALKELKRDFELFLDHLGLCIKNEPAKRVVVPKQELEE